MTQAMITTTVPWIDLALARPLDLLELAPRLADEADA